jgi:uncharacterized protein
MGDTLRPVPIPELRTLAEGRHWRIDQHLSALESLTPVRGELRAIHRGTVLEVEGEAATIVTLCCDRCLQHFNHPLQFASRELLWLEEAGRPAGQKGSGPLEADGALVLQDADVPGESLDPRGSFDPAHWTFEQLSLQLPLVNRCGSDCPGPAAWSSDPGDDDPRWAALGALRP